MPIPVSHLMRRANAAVVDESLLLRDAAELIVFNGYPMLAVVNKSQRCVGVLPESAVVRQLISTTDRQATIEPIVSRHAETVRQESDVSTVLHLFRSSCHSVIPVVDDASTVVGLLYRNDIVKFLLNEVTPEDAQPTPPPSHDGPHFKKRPNTTDARKPEES